MKISNRIKMFAATAVVAIAGFGCLISEPASAVSCGEGWTVKHGTCVQDGEENPDVWDIVKTAMNWVLAIVGVIATFMIIFGGIQYSTSAGDSGKVKKAKDTILYGIIGLVIALLAAAIVNFVLDGIFNTDPDVEDPDDAVVTTTIVA